MSLASLFKTNANLERKGVAIEMPAPNDDGSLPVFYLARAGRLNPDYQKVMERVMRPHRRAANLGVLPQAKQDELTREVFAEAGVLGWKFVPRSDVTGNKDDTGYAEYSKENAIALFVNLPDLYQALIEMSVERTTFQDADKEEDAKNSSRSLSTSTNRDQTSVS